MPFDSHKNATEDALLKAYGRGDVSAARELTARLTPRLMAHAMRMLGDRAAAEDIVQEAMLRLWRAAPGWQPGQAQPSTWAYRVTANLCVDQLRKKRSSGLGQIAEPVDPAESADAKMMTATRHAALQDGLAQLPERQAMAVSMRHLDGMSNPEIAAVMDIGVEAVESLTARARRKLAEILGKRKKELGYDG